MSPQNASCLNPNKALNERPGALCSALRGVECRDSAGAQHRTGFFGYRYSFWNRLTTRLHTDYGRLAVGSQAPRHLVPSLRTRRLGTTLPACEDFRYSWNSRSLAKT